MLFNAVLSTGATTYDVLTHRRRSFPAPMCLPATRQRSSLCPCLSVSAPRRVPGRTPLPLDPSSAITLQRVGRVGCVLRLGAPVWVVANNGVTCDEP